MNTIKNMLVFFTEAEKLKTITRHSYTTNANRQESSAEHSWMLAMMAMTLFDELTIKVDQLKVLKLVLIHDLAEAITSDIPAFEVSERQNNKKTAEREAFKKITASLPRKQAKEFLLLWEEFEANVTNEANVAQALDKIEVIIQHNLADSTTWDQGDYDIHPYYRNDFFHFDPFMRKFRDEVEIMSMEKILAAGALKRIKKEFAEMYRTLQKKAK